MADLLPSSPDASVGDGGDPRVIGVDSDDADALLSALQSETAREVLAALYDDPATPSALAEEVDTSIQNVRYHLEKLTDADLVEVADTIYSEKGREMKVYAPAAKPLVVFAGNDDDAPGIEAALSRLLGGLGILGLSSLAVQRFFGNRGVFDTKSTFTGESGGDAMATTTAEGRDTDVSLSNESVEVESETTTASSDAANSGSETAQTVTEAEATVTESKSAVTETAQPNVTEATRTIEEATRTVAETTATTESAVETTTAAARATTAAPEATTVAQSGASAVDGLAPGLVFFAGGLVALVALGVAWHFQGR